MEALEKTITFDDGSFARFILNEGKISFFIQSQHMGDEIKHTSLTVSLSEEETKDLLNWFKASIQGEE